jgi:hypothetical protein
MGFHTSALIIFVPIVLIWLIPVSIANSFPKSGNYIAFFVACVASFAISFFLDMLVLSILGLLEIQNALIPLLSWLGIGASATLTSFVCSTRPAILPIPFAVNGIIASAVVSQHTHNILVGITLIVIGVILFFLKKRFNTATIYQVN